MLVEVCDSRPRVVGLGLGMPLLISLCSAPSRG